MEAELTKRLGAMSVSIDADAQAQQVLDRLGVDWLEAALRPLTLSLGYPVFTAYLHLQDDEPMVNLSTPYSWGFAQEFGQGIHGSVTVRMREGEVPEGIRLQRKVVALPSLGLLEGNGEFTFIQRNGRLGRIKSMVYAQAYQRVPALLDTYRQSRNRKWSFSSGEVHRWADIRPYEVNPKNMWIAMHWAEPGGAESWGFEQARVAKEAGYFVVMTFDRIAPQRMLERAREVADVVMFTTAALDDGDDQRILIPRLLEEYQIGRIHVHHSITAYNSLRDIKRTLPQVVIDDSTHISEHRGGGFVTASRANTDAIDLHHVISPQLRDIFELESEIDPAKVAYRPLTRMGGQKQDVAGHAPSYDGKKPLRIGFLGRLSLQKRPYLFVEAAAVLRAHYGDRVRFVMQGSGDLDRHTTDRIEQLALTDVIERRPWGSVSDFMEQVDVLLVTSDNEGLTLTSIEASAAGVLVLSADVGSQRTVVPPLALLPAFPLPFLRQLDRTVGKLLDRPARFAGLLDQQLQMAQQLQELQSATEFFTQRYKEANK